MRVTIPDLIANLTVVSETENRAKFRGFTGIGLTCGVVFVNAVDERPDSVQLMLEVTTCPRVRHSSVDRQFQNNRSALF